MNRRGETCPVSEGGGEMNLYQIRNHANGAFLSLLNASSVCLSWPRCFGVLVANFQTSVPDIRPLLRGVSPNKGRQSSPVAHHKGRPLTYLMRWPAADPPSQPIRGLPVVSPESVIKSYLECNLSTH